MCMNHTHKLQSCVKSQRATVPIPAAPTVEAGVGAADMKRRPAGGRSRGVEGDPAEWRHAAAVMSQEGFPSAGVRRTRDVDPSASQWRLGGGSSAVNHTRILDAAWPEAGVQEEMLSDYPPATGPIDGLTSDDFGRIPLLTRH